MQVVDSSEAQGQGDQAEQPGSHPQLAGNRRVEACIEVVWDVCRGEVQ